MYIEFICTPEYGSTDKLYWLKETTLTKSPAQEAVGFVAPSTSTFLNNLFVNGLSEMEKRITYHETIYSAF